MSLEAVKDCLIWIMKREIYACLNIWLATLSLKLSPLSWILKKGWSSATSKMGAKIAVEEYDKEIRIKSSIRY